MSGGVDSSVSAALLKKAGFDVVGVYMKQWSPEILGKECIWKAERQDAMKAAMQIGIPFLTWDFSKEYEKYVGKYMIDSYRKGITPNPDVMCNKIIKFGFFYNKAMEQGADFVATGHYAVIKNGKLLKSKDKNKDQTYFLYEIKKEQLPKILFPVGGLEKPEVRKLAKKFGLHNAQKKDSQGVCFVGQFNMKEFLKMYIKPKPGKILSLDGKFVGDHDGVYYYTIGQRHGLDIKNGKGPYFVIKKDIKRNIIYVGSEKDLVGRQIKVKNINWLAKPNKFPAGVEVRTRYRAKLGKAKIKIRRLPAGRQGTVIFAKPERAITSGQSAVFYKGQQVLGGGAIE